ncbi:claudin-2 [Amia ocellicauda]|uniref:claudin-2 n=1 Tax=Amia ocellicauda TaxID=2972642 RepID=UPI003463B063
MGSPGLELLGFLLGLLGLLGTLVSTLLPNWRTTAFIGSNIITAVGYMKGLWMECAYYSTGSFQCETYNSLLALPSDLQAARALMVLSCVLSTLGCAVACLGMQCTVCLEGAPLKPRVAGAGGGCFLMAGFLCLIPVAWTTHEVVQLFYNPSVPSSYKFELGECLYVGMAAALTSMLGGGVLCLSCCGGEGERRRGGHRRGQGYPYPYPYPDPERGPHTHAHSQSHAMTFRNPLAHAKPDAVSKGQSQTRTQPHPNPHPPSHSDESRGSQSTQSHHPPPQGHSKRSPTGYDLTGYV